MTCLYKSMLILRAQQGELTIRSSSYFNKENPVGDPKASIKPCFALLAEFRNSSAAKSRSSLLVPVRLLPC